MKMDSGKLLMEQYKNRSKYNNQNFKTSNQKKKINNYKQN